MAEFTIQTEDGPKTFDISKVTLPAGTQLMETSVLSSDYVHNSVLKHTHKPIEEFKKGLDDRFKNWVKRDEVEEDAKVIQNILSKHGEQKVDIDQKERDWTEEKLTPVQDENTNLRRILTGRDTAVAAEKQGVDVQFLNPMKPGKPSFIEVQFGDAIQYDPKLGYAVAHDEDGKPIQSANATNDKPFQDANEYFAGLAETGVLDNYKKTPRKNAGVLPHKNGDGKATPSALRISEMDDDAQTAYVVEHGADKFAQLPD